MAFLFSFSWEDQCIILVLCLVDLSRRHQAALTSPGNLPKQEGLGVSPVWNQLHWTKAGPGVPLWYLGRISLQDFHVTAEGIKDAFVIFVFLLVKFHHNYSNMNHLQKSMLEQLLVVSVLLIKHHVRRRCLRNLSHNKILVEWEWLCWWLHIHWWIICSQMLKSC